MGKVCSALTGPDVYKRQVGELPRKLDPAKVANMEIKKISVDKATYDKMHAADRMASDKLAEGIDGFTKALVALEKLLAERLASLEGEVIASR